MKECPSCKRIWEDKVGFCPLDGQPLVEKAEEDIFIGKLLDDKYRLKEKVGEGGFGCVYKATHIGIDNTVAVKILHPHLASDYLSIERFRREARAAAQIRHPNAVAVTDFGVTKVEGTAYLVMEFLEGIDLRRKLKQEKQLDYQQAIIILIQACEAVHAAHLKGIIHRDLKPDNIWITQTDDGTEQVKVLDFGIAKLKAGAITAGADVNLTQQGVIVGTPHYMSPEQGRGEELDARSDIYSIGVILYEAIAGKVPFNGKTALDVVLKHNSSAPLSPSQLRPGIPERLEKIILRTLEKKQEARQESALQLAADLEAVLYDIGVPLQQARKRNSQWSLNSLPTDRLPTGAADVGDTKALNLRKDSKATSANRTMPMRSRPVIDKLDADAASTAAPQEDSAAPVADNSGGSTARKKQLYLYAGIGVVVLTLAILGVVKLFSADDSAPPGRTDQRPPSGMVAVTGGKFIMGTNNPATDKEKDATPATETEVETFFLDVREVTNEQYYEFIKATGRQPPSHWGGEEPDPSISQLPVVNVSWDDASEYAKHIGKRLPTEKEWEYAARGAKGYIYPWGNDWDPECSNSKEDEARGKGTKPVPVGSYTRCPSPCGAMDMAGNVAEWVEDTYKLYENSQLNTKTSGTYRVIRGGSFETLKDELKTYIRFNELPRFKARWLGFRCARSVPKAEASQ